MDLSTRLSYLFGTEEYVGIRRQLVILREKLFNYSAHQNEDLIICSGSLGEGVAFPKSDDDVMFYRTDIRVVNTYREATQRYDLLMVPSELSPGYCLLQDVKGSYSADAMHRINGMSFLSSSFWSQISLEEGQIIHGPCQSGRIGQLEYDFARCLPCYTWPDVANNWIIRNRVDVWPSCELIQNIVQNGCHVVAVGDLDSPNADHEWRISFSAAERTLMHSLNHAQFLTYNLLRLTLKRIIGKREPDVLCSYFMKTSLFYTAENTCLEFWRLNNIETSFNTCLSVLYDYIDYMYCPNYFIPEYNMIKRKINQSNRQQMLDIIRYVHDIGIIGVLHVSGESDCLDDGLSARLMECKLDREFMVSAHIGNVLPLVTSLYDLCHENIERCLYFTYNTLLSFRGTTENGLMDYVFNRGVTINCQHMLNHICISEEGNKRAYCLNKRLQCLLRQGYNGDVTTGKLTMATYMYMIGKTESALTIIRHLLSEYPPYVMDNCTDDIKVTTYIDVMCGRGYSIDYKVKRSYAPEFYLSDQCLRAFPRPLRTWISIMCGLDLHPLTYTFFLQSICYLKQQNERLARKSTRCLINHISDLKRKDDIAEARMCVGIIKYVQGDNQSACRWLGSVYSMKDTLFPRLSDIYSLSPLTYILCLLNEQYQA